MSQGGALSPVGGVRGLSTVGGVTGRLHNPRRGAEHSKWCNRQAAKQTRCASVGSALSHGGVLSTVGGMTGRLQNPGRGAEPRRALSLASRWRVACNMPGINVPLHLRHSVAASLVLHVNHMGARMASGHVKMTIMLVLM